MTGRAAFEGLRAGAGGEGTPPANCQDGSAETMACLASWGVSSLVRTCSKRVLLRRSAQRRWEKEEGGEGERKKKESDPPSLPPSSFTSRSRFECVFWCTRGAHSHSISVFGTYLISPLYSTTYRCTTRYFHEAKGRRGKSQESPPLAMDPPSGNPNLSRTRYSPRLICLSQRKTSLFLHPTNPHTHPYRPNVCHTCTPMHFFPVPPSTLHGDLWKMSLKFNYP